MEQSSEGRSGAIPQKRQGLLCFPFGASLVCLLSLHPRSRANQGISMPVFRAFVVLTRNHLPTAMGRYWEVRDEHQEKGHWGLVSTFSLLFSFRV